MKTDLSNRLPRRCGEVSNAVLVSTLLIMAVLGSALILYCNRGNHEPERVHLPNCFIGLGN